MSCRKVGILGSPAAVFHDANCACLLNIEFIDYIQPSLAENVTAVKSRWSMVLQYNKNAIKRLYRAQWSIVEYDAES